VKKAKTLKPPTVFCQSDPRVARQKQKNEMPARNGKLVGKESQGKSAENVRFEARIKHVGIDRSIVFMTNNFYRPIQVEDLVRVSSLSRRGFLKAFSKHTGAKPGALLNQLRIEHAKNILAKQDLTLKEIAKLCGYQSQNTFCVAFQRSTGLAPKQFQRNNWLAIIRNHQKPKRHCLDSLAESK
jgi:transcriptional regulator GlxA family with amidase domain